MKAQPGGLRRLDLTFVAQDQPVDRARSRDCVVDVDQRVVGIGAEDPVRPRLIERKRAAAREGHDVVCGQPDPETAAVEIDDAAVDDGAGARRSHRQRRLVIDAAAVDVDRPARVVGVDRDRLRCVHRR